MEEQTTSFTVDQTSSEGKNQQGNGTIFHNFLLVKEWYRWVFYIIAVFATIGVFGNLLTIIAFFKCQKLRKPTFYLICNLAVSDLVSCLLLYVLTFHQYIEEGILSMATKKYPCLITFWALNLAMYGSLGSVALISLERLFSLIAPLQHKCRLTPKKVAFIIIIMWVLVLLLTTPPLLGWNTWHPGRRCKAFYIVDSVYFYSIFIVVPIISMLILIATNIIIAIIAHSRRRTIHPVTNPPSGLKPVGSTSNNSSGSEKINKYEFKITKMLLIVVGIICISWIPYIIKINVIKILAEAEAQTSEYVSIIFDVSKMLMVAGVMMNPVIFAGQSKEFRLAYRMVFVCQHYN